MADNPTDQARYQMVGTRTAMPGGSVAEGVEKQLNAIETALLTTPEFAFDLSKALVESVCKTMLADIGKPADKNMNMPKLVKETTKRLALLPLSHPDQMTDKSAKETIGALSQVVTGLSELRNKYGVASHGRDIFSPRLSPRHAALAAQAADTVVSFLYRTHRDMLTRSPERIRYEDHDEFNDAYDSDNDPVWVGEIEMLASYVLFCCDNDAYRFALDEYLFEQKISRHIAGQGEADTGTNTEPDTDGKESK